MLHVQGLAAFAGYGFIKPSVHGDILASQPAFHRLARVRPNAALHAVAAHRRHSPCDGRPGLRRRVPPSTAA